MANGNFIDMNKLSDKITETRPRKLPKGQHKLTKLGKTIYSGNYALCLWAYYSRETDRFETNIEYKIEKEI